MKKKILAASVVVAAMFAGFFGSQSKPIPTFTMIKPIAVEQNQSQTVALTGTNFSNKMTLVIDGTAYPINVANSTSASFTFSPGMTSTVGFLPVQVKTANQVSNTLYFQVCAPLVITTEVIPMTVGVPIGAEGQLKTSGGCNYFQ